MLFKKSYSVATGTTEAAPDKQVLKVSKGVLNLWVVYMTRESANYLNVRVLYHGTQIYPFTNQEAVKAWFEPIGVPDNLLIDTPPYELVIESWNTAPTYSHEYHVHVNIEPKKPVKPMEEAARIWKTYKGFLGG